MMAVGEHLSPRTAPHIGDPYVALADRSALQAFAAERTGLGQVVDQFASEFEWTGLLRSLSATTPVQLALVTGRVVSGALAECGLDYVQIRQASRDLAVQTAAICSASLVADSRLGDSLAAHAFDLTLRDRELIEVIDRCRERDEPVAVEFVRGPAVIGSVVSTGRDVFALNTPALTRTWIPISHVVTASFVATTAQAD